ncbi:MAG TPA: hypothetical protein VNE59_08115 [Burkholderiales bacterium]|nr:hypothetical protein [Burkholderiales bacterium]
MNRPAENSLAAILDQDPERLNAECFCLSLDAEALRGALQSETGDSALYEALEARCPDIFSARPVFVAGAQLQRMAAIIRAIESVVTLPGYQEEVLASAPAIARHDPGNRGVFFGFDFHLRGDTLGLIEINTNAGGAMLNVILARAQRACCAAMEGLVPGPRAVAAFERRIIEMFRAESRLARRAGPLNRIAIVDESPEQQHLYPEFLLFQRLFRQHGIEALVAAPEELELREGKLWHAPTRSAVDLVYNRLTDFMLEQPDHAALREAYLSTAAVVTPHPRAHALYADKRNLVLLSDPDRLAALGVGPNVRETLLAGIPRTEIVTAANAAQLWSERRGYFFKPFAGFGGRAAYRGDKLTTRVWQEILRGGYVSQRMILPGERVIEDGASPQVLKFDLRNYVYDGAVQWLAARLYQGQTTNFRTPGGGFAPVYTTPDVVEGAAG